MTNLLNELNLVPLIDRRIKQSRLILFSKGVFGQAHIPIDRLRHPIRKTRRCMTFIFVICMLGPTVINLASYLRLLKIGIVSLRVLLVLPPLIRILSVLLLGFLIRFDPSARAW